MKIEKRASGSYRIRKMYNGQMYTVSFDHKPTQKEAMQAMAAELNKVQTKHEGMTFRAAAEKYMDSKKNILSPSTIRGYATIMKQISETFLAKNIYDITALDVQEEINRMAEKCSPKTVRNHHGFLSAVLGTFYPDLKLTTTLPQKIKNEPYIPSDDDMKKILAKEWVVKTTKTTASTREIVIPMEVADKIREQGYIYKGAPGKITDFLLATQKKLGLPHFSIHKLRHYFASKMSAMNVPEEDIMRFGGWETDYVMKGVYHHAMEDKNKKAQREAAGKLGNALFS